MREEILDEHSESSAPEEKVSEGQIPDGLGSTGSLLVQSDDPLLRRGGVDAELLKSDGDEASEASEDADGVPEAEDAGPDEDSDASPLGELCDEDDGDGDSDGEDEDEEILYEKDEPEEPEESATGESELEREEAEQAEATAKKKRRAKKKPAPVLEISHEELKKALEAVLFATNEPLPIRALADVFGGSVHDIRQAVEELREEYVDTGRAFRLEELAGGVQLLSQPAYDVWIRRFRQKRENYRLSAAAFETLAVIAYKQPIAKANLEAIRGVQCGQVIKNLLERGLVRVTGRDESLGRPLLYGTTPDFLESFGIASLRDLPQPELQPRSRPAQEVAPASAGESTEADASDGQSSSEAETEEVSIFGDFSEPPAEPEDADEESTEDESLESVLGFGDDAEGGESEDGELEDGEVEDGELEDGELEDGDSADAEEEAEVESEDESADEEDEDASRNDA